MIEGIQEEYETKLKELFDLAKEKFTKEQNNEIKSQLLQSLSSDKFKHISKDIIKKEKEKINKWL